MPQISSYDVYQILMLMMIIMRISLSLSHPALEYQRCIPQSIERDDIAREGARSERDAIHCVQERR